MTQTTRPTPGMIAEAMPAFRIMQNAISEAIAAAQVTRGNCDPDGDPCGADCACLRLVREELDGRLP